MDVLKSMGDAYQTTIDGFKFLGYAAGIGVIVATTSCGGGSEAPAPVPPPIERVVHMTGKTLNEVIAIVGNYEGFGWPTDAAEKQAIDLNGLASVLRRVMVYDEEGKFIGNLYDQVIAPDNGVDVEDDPWPAEAYPERPNGQRFRVESRGPDQHEVDRYDISEFEGAAQEPWNMVRDDGYY